MKQTALYTAHKQANATMVPFAGWEMPLHYGSQVKEHLQVRKTAGIFDVSHMTTIDIYGDSVKEYLLYVLANDVNKLKTPGKALYSCMLNEEGGILDDLICYYINNEHYRLVVNAATTESDVAWLKIQADSYKVTLKVRDDLSMLALQGPKAEEYVQFMVLPEEYQQIKNLNFFEAVQLDSIFVARTGYTGEDGFECILSNNIAEEFWHKALKAGFLPCGLGARDTLRLESGLNLYGTDMDETLTPLESNLAWTVSMKDTARNFIGREKLLAQKEEGVYKQLVGLVLKDKGILRGGQKVRLNEKVIGKISSGSFGPSLNCSIAFAKLDETVSPSDKLEVEIRKKWHPCQIVKPPFIKNGQPNF